MINIARALDTSVGSKFLAVDNRDLVSLLETQFGAQSLEIIRPRGNGDRMLAKVSLPDLGFNEPDLGGIHVPHIWVRNSNEGDLALTVGVGLFRMVCLNGLYSGFAAFGAKVRHTDGPTAHRTLDALPAAMGSALESIASGAVLDTAMESLETRVIDPIDVIGSLPNVSLRTKDQIIDTIILESYRSTDRPDTAWGLYNIVNEIARKRGKSLYRTALNDIGLMENIVTLAQSQLRDAA